MFDLNDAIKNWRRNIEEGGKIECEDIDELESHLWDELDQLAKMGPVREEDFSKAVVELGDVSRLNEEFSKIHTEGSGLVEIIEGEVLAMSSGKTFRSDRFITVLLFIGFCGIIGWLGTFWWLLDNTNFRGTDFWQVVNIIDNGLLWSSFFLVFALIGIPWGLRLLRRSERKMKLVIRSLIPAIVLSPAYILLGVLIILLTPFVSGWVKAISVGPNIVQSQLSPDGKFEAYVIDKPSIDPPNHHLYIRRNDVVRRDNLHYSRPIAQLPEDVDFIQKIHWSPHSDIVVFQSYFSLIAVCVPDYKILQIPLGGGWHWRKNGTFWVDYNDVERIATIEFPESGVFSYRLEGSPQFKTVKMDSL